MVETIEKNNKNNYFSDYIEVVGMGLIGFLIFLLPVSGIFINLSNILLFLLLVGIVMVNQLTVYVTRLIGSNRGIEANPFMKGVFKSKIYYVRNAVFVIVLEAIFLYFFRALIGDMLVPMFFMLLLDLLHDIRLYIFVFRKMVKYAL